MLEAARDGVGADPNAVGVQPGNGIEARMEGVRDRPPVHDADVGWEHPVGRMHPPIHGLEHVGESRGRLVRKIHVSGLSEGVNTAVGSSLADQAILPAGEECAQRFFNSGFDGGDIGLGLPAAVGRSVVAQRQQPAAGDGRRRKSYQSRRNVACIAPAGRIGAGAGMGVHVVWGMPGGRALREKPDTRAAREAPRVAGSIRNERLGASENAAASRRARLKADMALITRFTTMKLRSAGT